MSVKIRLQRHGRKNKPHYKIVVADSRAKRDGRFVERLGFYDPNTAPVKSNIDIEKSINWLSKGAIPTDTCKSLLSKSGVMFKHHLLKGVTKNALTQEEAEKRFEIWLDEKKAKLNSKDSEKKRSKPGKKKRALAAKNAESE